MSDSINRLWAEVYDPSGTFLGQVNDIVNADSGEFLDGVGSFSMLLTGTVEEDFTLLVAGNRVVIYIQEFDGPRLFGGGIVRSVKVSDGASGVQMMVSGPDFLDELTRKSVLLGRSFNNATLDTVFGSLIGLVPGWTATTLESLGNMSGRFDGASVLNALIRIVQENGIHFRLGDTNTDLEYGAFGNSNGLILRNPPGSVTEEIDDNDDILFVTSISQDTDSDKVVDWIIPLGAGEGSAGWTLRYSTRTAPYPIQTMTGPDGSTLYYLTNAASPAAASQRVVTFKEIGPIANSDSAKILASNALYDAAVAWLQRNSVPLTTYTVSCAKNRVNVKPGDMIRLTYKGRVTTSNKKWFNRIDVDEDFWVMKVTEKATSGGTSLQLTISSVDRYKQDTTQMIVGALESINATKVAVQSFPFMSERSSSDFVGYDWQALTKRPAIFSIKVDEKITDIVQVAIRFKSRPLLVTNFVPTPTVSPWAVVYQISEGSQHPKGVHLFVDDVDVSAAFGGPWNNRISGTPGIGWTIGQYENNALDVTCDITPYILSSPLGFYADHIVKFEVQADHNAFSYVVPGSGTSGPLTGDATSGLLECNINILGTARAVFPVT